jgi:Methyltransferase domain
MTPHRLRAMLIEHFQNEHYQRHNRRRQEHLATLGLPLAGRKVLELGAGIGDHTSFFLDRDCGVTVTDARAENVAHVQARFPSLAARVLDIEQPLPPDLEPHDIVYAYGILYHLADPGAALRNMAELTNELLLLETCVSFGAEEAINVVDEDVRDPTQAAHGVGCRPTRAWVFNGLKRQFPNVYQTRTQPWHEEFPLRWDTAPPVNASGLHRCVFVAARHPLQNPQLADRLLSAQVRE